MFIKFLLTSQAKIFHLNFHHILSHTQNLSVWHENLCVSSFYWLFWQASMSFGGKLQPNLSEIFLIFFSWTSASTSLGTSIMSRHSYLKYCTLAQSLQVYLMKENLTCCSKEGSDSVLEKALTSTSPAVCLILAVCLISFAWY